MASAPTTAIRRPEVYDLLAVGFGPSNLALAIAAREHGEARPDQAPLTVGFLERKPAFGWHRGMLLDGATMQISFLKDLATLRDPASRFTFLTYLNERGRLADFVNHKTFFPTRIEFHDYLEWAAARFTDQVEYGVEVVDVRPVHESGEVTYLDVVARRMVAPDQLIVRRTRNLVIGVGISPVLPPGVEGSERVWHSSELLERLPSAGVAQRFAVVGSGQSGAEVTAHLHDRFPDADVHAVFTRYGYSPADDSPFANRIFDPGAVDDFYHAPKAVKEMFYAYHSNTNYSVVDLELIEDLYRRVYAEHVQGNSRLRIHQMARMTNVVTKPDHVLLSIDTLLDGKQHDLEVDVLVCATGYEPMNPLAVLGEAVGLCERTDAGRLRVERDYRVTTDDRVRCGIYLQGGTEHSHGISSSLLSTTAVRAGEIVDSVARAGKAARHVRA